MIKQTQYSKKICLLLCFTMLFTLVGCSYKDKNYTNSSSIASNDNFSTQGCSINYSDDGRSIFGKIENLNGHFELAQTNVLNNCYVEICFSGSIKSGKAKLVLVKPDATVENLKEVTADKNDSYTENICVSCDIGINKIKLVGESYKGNFEISQNGKKLFNYTHDDMFDKGFPFN